VKARPPGIVYGGKSPAVVIELDHNALYHQLRQEAFPRLRADAQPGRREGAGAVALGQHASVQVEVQHIDFQRVLADVKIQMKCRCTSSTPISRGRETFGRYRQPRHERPRIRCLPADLPEFIEVDLKDMALGNTVHVRDLPAAQMAWRRSCTAARTRRLRWCRSRARWWRTRRRTLPAAEAAVSAADVPTTKQSAEPAAAEKGGEKGGDKGEKKSEKSDKK